MMQGNSVQCIADYFDARAEGWLEAEKHTTSPVQPAVALMAGVGEGSRVLDIGCGLGVMMPIYLELGAAAVVGVDVSDAMVAQARERWTAHPQIDFVAADAAQLTLDSLAAALKETSCAPFDSLVIYNAYPHLMSREALVGHCAELLRPQGRFAVAHGAGKDTINSHHEAVAAGVSLGLGAAEDEAKAWEPLFSIDGLVDTPGFYGFCGARR